MGSCARPTNTPYMMMGSPAARSTVANLCLALMGSRIIYSCPSKTIRSSFSRLVRATNTLSPALTFNTFCRSCLDSACCVLIMRLLEMGQIGDRRRCALRDQCIQFVLYAFLKSLQPGKIGAPKGFIFKYQFHHLIGRVFLPQFI